MIFIKELIHRRIPHIIGSYIIAGTSFILFVDWLVNRYLLPEHYATIVLFSIIVILPSVIIISYFHGAPGKDEQNKIEKININLKNKFYKEGTITISDDMSYYLEVIDVTDSTATVKLFDTKMPCTYIMVGDFVEIMK